MAPDNAYLSRSLTDDLGLVQAVDGLGVVVRVADGAHKWGRTDFPDLVETIASRRVTHVRYAVRER